ncbi:MAG: hypothetical protein K1Y36_20575 [Blastocatellia bacterium]|nr:hypothetical protein [Blastocatellia bacterium]
MTSFELIISIELGVLTFMLVVVLVAVLVALNKTVKLLASIQQQTEPVLKQVRDTTQAIKPLLEQAQKTVASLGPILDQTQQTLGNVRETSLIAKQTVASLKIEAEACMAAISTTTRELAKMTQEEAREVQAVVQDTTTKLRGQVERLDRVTARTAARIDDTAALVQHDVMRPLREISALLAALKTFLEVLFAAQRKQIDQAYHDEEMFI